MTVLSKFLLANCAKPSAKKVANLSGVVFIRPDAIDSEYSDFLVQTTTKEIEKTIDDLRKEDELAKNCIQVTQFSESTRIVRMSKAVKEKQKKIFDEAYKLITRYSNEELTIEYEMNSKKFKDWCNDVVIYCCHDFHLNGNPMPIANRI